MGLGNGGTKALVASLDAECAADIVREYCSSGSPLVSVARITLRFLNVQGMISSSEIATL